MERPTSFASGGGGREWLLQIHEAQSCLPIRQGKESVPVLTWIFAWGGWGRVVDTLVLIFFVSASGVCNSGDGGFSDKGKKRVRRGLVAV